MINGNFPLSIKYDVIASSTLLPYASTLRLSDDTLAFLIIFKTRSVTIKASIAIITSTATNSINVKPRDFDLITFITSISSNN